MSRRTRTVVLTAIILATGFFSFAGSLNPPGPPAPTMVTLQQIYDKLDGLVLGKAPVPKTGQTGCWDASGNSISCAGTGQDGEHQKGILVSPRFTDNSDGTVKDNLTGLFWLKNANCFGLQNWTSALSRANTLASGSCGLTDASVAGDWRLPTVKELWSLINFGQVLPALSSGHPFAMVQSDHYWSSTSVPNNPYLAWRVYLSYGDTNGVNKTTSVYVWPVRGGQ